MLRNRIRLRYQRNNWRVILYISCILIQEIVILAEIMWEIQVEREITREDTLWKMVMRDMEGSRGVIIYRQGVVDKEREEQDLYTKIN